MADIQLEAVISSNIKAIGFDSVTGVMRVQFLNGGTYDASGVKQEDFDNFKSSKSKGVHFNKVLKKAFAWSKAIEKKG
jgi:hypothetical protein